MPKLPTLKAANRKQCKGQNCTVGRGILWGQGTVLFRDRAHMFILYIRRRDIKSNLAKSKFTSGSLLGPWHVGLPSNADGLSLQTENYLKKSKDSKVTWGDQPSAGEWLFLTERNMGRQIFCFVLYSVITDQGNQSQISETRAGWYGYKITFTFQNWCCWCCWYNYPAL